MNWMKENTIMIELCGLDVLKDGKIDFDLGYFFYFSKKH